ncbi:Bikaverin cluster transcription factor bik5 [Exophiala dermatitidis]
MEASHSQPPEDSTAPSVDRSTDDGSTGAHPPSNPSVPRLNPRSCVTCRRRKVRCNKQNPCANCVRAGIECVFPGPGRAPRKSRKPPDSELLARLQRLEGVVRSLGAHVDENGLVSATLAGSSDLRARFGDGSQPGDSPTSDRSDPGRQSVDKQLGRLVISDDRSRYLSNSFWTSMNAEIAEMRDLLDSSSSGDDGESFFPQNNRVLNHQTFLFGYSAAMVDLHELHPTPSQTFILWEIFKENVDPVVRIVHRPTARTMLMNAATHLGSLSKPAEALLFSIYFGAVVSLSDEQCRQLLDEDKDTLIKKYRFATEQALARADFLNSSSLMCLQAFAFFLLFVRSCDDSRTVWSLGGLAIRLAHGLGIHRDGSHFGLNPFNIEMRRRLWWNLSVLDNRSAEDHGTDPTFTEHFYDTKLPRNYNDEDIHPGMKQYPPERQGATEMTFSLIRFELSIFFRRLMGFAKAEEVPGSDGWTMEDKDKMIDDCHRMLEEKYLRHCDLEVPIYYVAVTVSRLILAKMWLMVHQPRSFNCTSGATLLENSCRDRILITSVEVMEFFHVLCSNQNTAKWAWLFRSYMQWQSVAFALSEICVRPPGPDVERAWQAIESIYHEHLPTNNRLQRAVRWKPLRQLMARARERRAAQQTQGAQPANGVRLFSDIPPVTSLDQFIQELPDNFMSTTMRAFGLDSPTTHPNPALEHSEQGESGTAGRDMSTDNSHDAIDAWVGPDSRMLGLESSDVAGTEPTLQFLMRIQEDWF